MKENDAASRITKAFDKRNVYFISTYVVYDEVSVLILLYSRIVFAHTAKGKVSF